MQLCGSAGDMIRTSVTFRVQQTLNLLPKRRWRNGIKGLLMRPSRWRRSRVKVLFLVRKKIQMCGIWATIKYLIRRKHGRQRGGYRKLPAAKWWRLNDWPIDPLDSAVQPSVSADYAKVTVPPASERWRRVESWHQVFFAAWGRSWATMLMLWLLVISHKRNKML